MARALFVAAVVSLAFMSSATAQNRPTRQNEPQGGPGVRSGNITSTGQTVPNPGASQGAGTTPLDKGVQNEDNKIQSSICKGC